MCMCFQSLSATCTGIFCEYCGWTSVVYSCLPLPLLMSQIHIYAEYCGGLTCGHFEDPNPRGGELHFYQAHHPARIIRFMDSLGHPG